MEKEDTNEILLPDPIAFSFSGPGWTVLCLLLLLMVLVLLLYKWKQYKKNKYRKQWLIQLKEAEMLEAPAGFFESNYFLKRMAIKRYNRELCASLIGEDWFDFLNSKCKSPVFQPEQDALLVRQSYFGAMDAALQKEYIVKIKKWITQHDL